MQLNRNLFTLETGAGLLKADFLTVAKNKRMQIFLTSQFLNMSQ